MICNKCGKTLPDDSTFCQFCGSQLETPTFTPHIDHARIFHQTMDSSNKNSRKKVKYCSRCGGVIDSKTKQCASCEKKHLFSKLFNRKTILPMILSFLLLVSLIFNIVLAVDLDYYRSRTADYYSINSKLSFYEKHVVCVPNDGSKKYHKYGCSKFYQDDGYWAFNVEAAKDRGYKPCNYCIND